MRLKSFLPAFAMTSFAIAACLFAPPAGAKTFRFAFIGDYKALDPYSLNESFSIALHENVYEGLLTRDKSLKLAPALAESWETPEPTRWRIHLRHGVKFAGGEDFTADDVLFSADRIRAPGSDLASRVPKDAKVVKIDDYTVDFVLAGPNPILNAEWESFFIMSKKWAEEHDVVKPTPVNATTPSYASLHSNGTGPFIVASHQPGVKTVWKANPAWWGKKEHNLDEVVFTPIASDPTRVAALLSGEVDWMDPVPVQDVARVNESANASVLGGPELRTIFLGFDQKRDELKYSSVKGKNPFKDVRVRKAFYQAIDIETIKAKVMRGYSTPSALMIAPSLFEKSGEFKRFPYDPAAAKKLLAEAGYPDGFQVTMDCPNDRYVNDEAICQAIVGMLARAGMKIDLLAQPKAKYFAKILAAGGFDTSFFLLGWTPSTLDSHNVLAQLENCRDEKGTGSINNVGGYCNPKVDDLTRQILVEADAKKRDELIAEAFKTTTGDVSHIPLHQQALAWGVSKKVKIFQRPDNYLLFNWVTME